MKEFKGIGYDEIWEMVSEEIDLENTLRNRDAILLVDGEYYNFVFEDIDADDLSLDYRNGTSFNTYKISVYTPTGEFVEDLDLFVRQHSNKYIKYESYYSSYIYEYDRPFRVSAEEVYKKEI